MRSRRSGWSDHAGRSSATTRPSSLVPVGAERYRGMNAEVSANTISLWSDATRVYHALAQASTSGKSPASGGSNGTIRAFEEDRQARRQAGGASPGVPHEEGREAGADAQTRHDWRRSAALNRSFELAPRRALAPGSPRGAICFRPSRGGLRALIALSPRSRLRLARRQGRPKFGIALQRLERW